MIHSFLIVGGTVNKRKLEATRPPASSLAGEVGRGNLKLEKKLDAGNSKSSFQFPVSSPASSFQPQASDIKLQSAVDVTVLEPEEDKQTISIDQIRNLQHQLSLRPYAAKFKTGIILEAQRMTVEAQNALLKTLEEPPAHSILILTAPSAKSLLPTIVSRCQVVRLRAEIDLDVESEEHHQAVEEFLQLLGSGRPARSDVRRSESGGGERLAWVEEHSSNLKSQISNLRLLDTWISVLRDLLLVNSGCQSLTLNSFNGSFNSSIPSSNSFRPLNLPNPKSSSNTSALCSAKVLSKLLTMALESTIKTKNLIAKTNISPRLALEVLLLDLPVLQPSQP